MPKVTITAWEYIPPKTNDSGFLDYKLTGTCDNKPFSCTIGCEIDGRDVDYTHHSGPQMCLSDFPGEPVDDICDRWDALQLAMSEHKELCEDMDKRS